MTRVREVTFSVPFVAGKARVRVTRHGNYTPPKTRRAEQAIREAYEQAVADKGGTVDDYHDLSTYPRFRPTLQGAKRVATNLFKLFSQLTSNRGLALRTEGFNSRIEEIVQTMWGLEEDHGAFLGEQGI